MDGVGVNGNSRIPPGEELGLRATCRLGTTDYYDGTLAEAKVATFLATLAKEAPDGDWYQRAEELMRQQEHRLPEGCTAKQLDAA